MTLLLLLSLLFRTVKKSCSIKPHTLHIAYYTSTSFPSKIKMKVTIDRYRIFNLVLLLACSGVLAEIIIFKFEWSRLSAYGFTITICVQISNAINQLDVEAQQNKN